MTTYTDPLTRAIQALHAVLSTRPHWSAVQKNPDAYIQFAAAVERAANEVRDAQDALQRPTHQHRKGGMYRFLGYGKVQTDTPLTDHDAVVLYRGQDGDLWVRPNSEFHDGRFKALPE